MTARTYQKQYLEIARNKLADYLVTFYYATFTTSYYLIWKVVGLPTASGHTIHTPHVHEPLTHDTGSRHFRCTTRMCNNVKPS